MATGTIKTLKDNGFGFLTLEGYDKDVFFHAKNLVDVEFAELSEGDAITCEVEETDRGLNATNVRRA